MLDGSETKNKRSCWIDWTELEKGLTTIIIISALLITTLVVLLLLYTKPCAEELQIGNATLRSCPSFFQNSAEAADPETESCTSNVCLKEALEILSRIDLGTNPCTDFYTFACKNMPEIPDRKQYYGPFTPLIDKAKAKIEELYNEPIFVDDHDLVKAQKKLYQACMNETAIASTAFDTLVQVLKFAGGWPVVEGDDWNLNNKKFNWLESTYILRDLGYAYNSFLELNLVLDPEDQERYIFQVSLPEVDEIQSRWFDSDEKHRFMADVAEAFGAEVHNSLSQMSETYQFLRDLQWHREESEENDGNYYRMTVAEYQVKEDSIDWLQFINRIAGPYAHINKHDFAMFPSEMNLDAWFGLIARASNRTLANYMMWRVVEDSIPYLTEELKRSRVKPRLMAGFYGYIETRSEFCMDTISKSFSPNPIEVMYMRQYLPHEKREVVEELLIEFTEELLRITDKIDWMDLHDKESAKARIRDVNLVIGASGDYFSDDIFENFVYDMRTINSNNFLNLFSQARKANENRLFSLYKKPMREAPIEWENVIAVALDYDMERNEIYVPASIIQGAIFNEDRPNYLNYANFGLALKYFFLRILGSLYHWSSLTEEAFDKKRECLISETDSEVITIPNHMVDGLIAHNLALRVSHDVYKRWARDSKEKPLSNLPYTPEQLFWLSSGYLFCQYKSPFFTDHLDKKAANEYVSMVKKLINNNVDLALDYNCKSKEESADKCQIF